VSAGYLLRVEQARARAAEALCSCGHAMGDHRERGYVWVTRVDGTVKELPRKGHKVGRFFCTAPECDCWLEP